MNIHAFSDTIMQGLMDQLNIPIPPWILWRRVRVTCHQNDSNKHKSTITIEGRDPDNDELPFTLFESMQVTIDERAKEELTEEPFVFEVSNKNVHPIAVRLLFYNLLKGEWRKTIDEIDLPV